MSMLTIILQNVPLVDVSQAWRNIGFELRQNLLLDRTDDRRVAVYAPMRRGLWARVFGPGIRQLGHLPPEVSDALSEEIDRGEDFRVWLVDVQAPHMRPDTRDMGFRVTIGKRS